MSRWSGRDLALAAVVGLASLASLVPMSAVFVAADWITPTLVSAVAALVLAVVARGAGLGALPATVLSVAGLLVVQARLHLPDAGLLPWLDDVTALRELAGAGVVALRDEAAPAQPLPGLLLLVSTGAWAVTWAAHELAVRVRSSGLALVPLAALWVVPLAVPQAVPPSRLLAVPFLLAAALVLLVDADADLAGWARDRVGPRVSVAGVGVAAGAISIGLVAPWLLPGIDQPAVLEVGTGRNPRGYQPIVDIGDRLTLPIDRPVLRVRAERRTYLRLAALDTYDDDTWRIGPAGEDSFTPEQADLRRTDEELPFETPISESTTTVVDVEVLDLENIYVPTPYQPVSVSGPDADSIVWSTVGGFLATGELSENEIGGTLRTGVEPGFEYRVVAAVPTPTIDELRGVDPGGASVDEWLQLPGPAQDWEPYAALAEEVWTEAGATTTVDRVLAVQRWFTDEGGFRYSLSDVDRLRGSSALETFVFDTRTGYCEYFSTAMAVMLRAAGIPARTAVGFLPGERVATAPAGAEDPRDTYQVSTSDAHAWVEVLFPGYGWITFDPTPRADGATLAPDEDDLTPELPVAERPDEPTTADDPAGDAVTPDLPPAAVPEVPGLDDPTGQPGAGTGGTADGDGADRWSLVVALFAVATAGLVALRRRRGTGAPVDGREAALTAQRRVLREGDRLGAGRHESETAGEVLHRWAQQGLVDPTAAATLARLGQTAAFARRGTDVDGARATAAGDRLVGELRAAVPRRARALAPVRVPARRSVAAARRLVSSGRDRLGV